MISGGKSAEVLLTELGMSPEQVDFHACTQAFLTHMKEGLAGRPSTIMMLPAYLTAGGALPLDTPVAVVDAGGTNLRTALVTFTAGGPKIENIRHCPMPGTEGPVPWDGFISRVADLLMDSIEPARAVGFCFSFPAQVTPNRDARVIRFSKQVKVGGYEGKYLCAGLTRELERRGVGRRAVLLNDTTAALLGGAASFPEAAYDGLVGLIWGTGLNTCCELPCSMIPKLGEAQGSMLVNLESGAFSALTQGAADKRVDAATRDPGTFLYEKMAAGAYLGEVARHTLLLCADRGAFSPATAQALGTLDKLPTPDLDRFAEEPAGDSLLSRLCACPEDRILMAALGRGVMERAARLVCCNLAALFLLTGRGRDPARPMCIVAEGSSYGKSSLLRTALKRALDQSVSGTLGRAWVIRQVSSVNFLGAAAAVLLNP